MSKDFIFYVSGMLASESRVRLPEKLGEEMVGMELTKEEATEFFSELYGGKHHIPRGGLHDFGCGWSVNHYGDLSTFDFDELTCLVFLCHDRAIRAEVMCSGPRMVKISIWKRKREGDIRQAPSNHRTSPRNVAKVSSG